MRSWLSTGAWQAAQSVISACEWTPPRAVCRRCCALSGPALNICWPYVTATALMTISVQIAVSLPRLTEFSRSTSHLSAQESCIVQGRTDMQKSKDKEDAAKGHVKQMPKSEETPRCRQRVNLQA